MKEPDFSKAFPRRFITMSMQDKYMAVCFIYDGIQYQNLCKEEGPNGTFSLSEKCLNKLNFNLPHIGFVPNTSANNEKGLVPYDPDQAEFPDILSAISYYWIEVLLLCLLSAITFHLAFVFLRRRSSRYSGTYANGRLSTKNNYRLSAGPTVDEMGTISIGKISFDPKSVLGYGSKGTCVFKGSFEDSLNCAVKRVVSQYLSLADREVDFLRSLQHPNLVRYLATEEDAQFIYIALELAEFTLGDLVETKRVADIGLSKMELCRQSALGLQHLHKLNIAHRDIKPQNILISFPMKHNDERKVMISDFGLSKQLSNLDTGHTSSAMRYFDGTQGWMAPEIVNAKISEDKSLLPTKSADIFSLGCVFYYILSDGHHPFGKIDQRQSNILKNNSVLDMFMNTQNNLNISEDKTVMATILIRAMIDPEPKLRPPISNVLIYPLFWPQADQLQFLQDVSDRIDKEVNGSEVLRRVECKRRKLFGISKWSERLSEELRTDLKNHRSYNENSVRHLLRAIRNKKNHYRDLSEDVKASLGDIPDGLMDYFSSRFPELLPHVYQAMQLCKEENVFKPYYEQSEDFVFNQKDE